MHRRLFLQRTAACTALAATGLTANPLFAQTTPATPPTFTPTFVPLRRGVGFFTARGGTMGWLVNSEAVAVIDAQFPDTATRFLAELPGRTGRRVDLLINTHHHGDHTAGNKTFAPETDRIVAHTNVPALQRQRAEQAGSLDAQVYADTLFDESWRQDLGDETVSARYFGPAHTKGDVVVMFEKANVVHLGDLMFNRVYPVIDRAGGASISSWIQVLGKIAANYPADALYLFGHGGPRYGVVGTRADLLILRDYLEGLLDHVRRQIAAGTPKEALMKLDQLPGFTDFHQPPPNRLAANLSVAYEELGSIL